MFYVGASSGIRHYVRMDDMTAESLREFLFDTKKMQHFWEKRIGGEYNHVAGVLAGRGRKQMWVYNLFLEESTRTRDLFGVAAPNLGGVVRDVVDPQNEDRLLIH